ncbi:MAG TPA: DNA repair protein RadC [Candidatus Nanoarchaeia archaeon]|nr:DNA repair protein RadC [Candidatus Nanoarchaeia archaeon]
MRLKDIPFYNKPGYKLSQDKVLDDAELLAIILEKGIKLDESSVELANKLLSKHKSLAGLSNLSLTELKKEIGTVKSLKIKALFELYRKTSRLKRGGFKPTIECAQDVYNYFVDRLKDLKKEHFYALLLDTKNRIIKEELISVGTLNSSLVHPREVFKEAIRNSANAIILVHNHPSGDCEPSEEDKEVTFRIKKIASMLKINLLDHIILSGDCWFSFEEKIK